MYSSIYELGKKEDIMRHLFQVLFIPVKLTWIQAIQEGIYTTWPGMTGKLVKNHLPKSMAIVPGHLQKFSQNARLTMEILTVPDNQQHGVKTEIPAGSNTISMKVVGIIGKVYSD